MTVDVELAGRVVTSDVINVVLPGLMVEVSVETTVDGFGPPSVIVCVKTDTDGG